MLLTKRSKNNPKNNSGSPNNLFIIFLSETKNISGGAGSINILGPRVPRVMYSRVEFAYIGRQLRIRSLGKWCVRCFHAVVHRHVTEAAQLNIKALLLHHIHKG